MRCKLSLLGLSLLCETWGGEASKREARRRERMKGSILPHPPAPLSFTSFRRGGERRLTPRAPLPPALRAVGERGRTADAHEQCSCSGREGARAGEGYAAPHSISGRRTHESRTV